MTDPYAYLAELSGVDFNNPGLPLIVDYTAAIAGMANFVTWARADNGVLAGGAGTGARAGTPTMDIGGVATIPVAAGGSGYTVAPTVSILGDGTGAAAHALLTAGVVTSIVVDVAGSGYSAPPRVQLGLPVALVPSKGADAIQYSQGTATAQPIRSDTGGANGTPTLVFDGTTDGLVAPGTLLAAASPFTIVLAGVTIAAFEKTRFLIGETTDRAIFVTNAGLNFRVGASGQILIAKAGIPTNVPLVIAAGFSGVAGANATWLQVGTGALNRGTPPGLPAAPRDFRLGGAVDASRHFGEIADTILVAADLRAAGRLADLRAIGEYAFNRYALPNALGL